MEIKTLDKIVTLDVPSNKHLGILVSGGLDSALLLFLVIKKIIDNNILCTYTAYTVPNVKDNAEIYSKQVVKYLENYFQIKINHKIIGDGTLPPRKLINIPSGYLLDNSVIDILYSAQNQFPPDAQSWKVYTQNVGINFKRRDPNLPDPPRVKYPFIKLYKSHILELYRHFQLLDLAAITHSCTELQLGKCNRCIWCLERQWAFTALNLKDFS